MKEPLNRSVLLAFAIMNMFWSQSCSQASPDSPQEIVVRVSGPNGEPVEGVDVISFYPTSADRVGARTDAQGICALKLNPQSSRADIVIYVKKGEGTLSQIVVPFGTSSGSLRRQATVGEYIEYDSDGNVKRKNKL